LIVAILSLCLGGWASDSAKGTAELERTFTARDSIEWARVLPFAQESTSTTAGGASNIAAFSFDRSRFIAHVSRGDLARNSIVDTLLIYRVDDVRRFLEAPRTTKLPSPHVLVQRETKHEEDAIQQPQWVSGNEVGFIAEDATGRNQVYVVNTTSSEATQVTNSPSDITSFAMSGDSILYYALGQPPSRAAHPLTVGSRGLGDIIDPQFLFEQFPIINLFVQSRRSGRVSPITAPAMRMTKPFQRIWLSPSGDSAITFEPAVDWPPDWAEYKIPRYEVYGFSRDRASGDPTAFELNDRVRYRFVDLKKMTARTLVNSPTGYLSFNYSPSVVYWPEGRDAVIVANTFLPVANTVGTERALRRQFPAIAEVDLRSGKITVIRWEPAAVEDPTSGHIGAPNRILSVDFKRDTLAVTLMKSADDRAERNLVKIETFKKLGTEWASVDSTEEDRADDLTVTLDEGLNERPRIYASERACDCRRELLDPNPQAEHFNFGQTHVFTWIDANGIHWTGGLTLPPRYVSGRRYPMIVQTHGFSRQEFEIDGPHGTTTAFASQAFANAGIVVLQVEDNTTAFTGDERQAVLCAEGIRAAIEALVRNEVADPEAIGAIGWSITGHHVLQLLMANPRLLRAATISDAAMLGLWSRLLAVGLPLDIQKSLDKLTGGAPDLLHLNDWIGRNPIYKLPETTTPIRLEAIGPHSLINMWEIYAVLRYSTHAVDLIYFPTGRHSLIMPLDRLHSQGGDLDWFRFWLQGCMDLSPDKADTYKDWLKMRGRDDPKLEECK
jgi:hypothetical protein